MATTGPTFTELKPKHRRLRREFASTLDLRIHRALSWIESAERATNNKDEDSAFISYWIAFNAAYVQPPELQKVFPDRELFRRYFARIVELDRAGVIYDVIWSRFAGPVRVLLGNQFVYQPFWDWRHGEAGAENWQGRFRRSREDVNRALRNKDTTALLRILFDRLYVLRNQLIHGGATWQRRTEPRPGARRRRDHGVFGAALRGPDDGPPKRALGRAALSGGRRRPAAMNVRKWLP